LVVGDEARARDDATRERLVALLDSLLLMVADLTIPVEVPFVGRAVVPAKMLLLPFRGLAADALRALEDDKLDAIRRVAAEVAR
jgi:hypothetical protein